MKTMLALLCLASTLALADPLTPPPLGKVDLVELPPMLPPGTFMAPFVISGGEVVNLPITDRGPVPARGGGYGMEFVGPLIGPLSKGSKVAGITWSFAISAQIGNRCREVLIEDVTGKEPVLLARVENPLLDPGVLRFSSGTSEISEAATPWLFDQKATIKVFRITFTAPDGKKTVLLQPAWYSKEAKAGLREVINNIRNG